MSIVKTLEGVCYEYEFTVTFQETNIVGNVYFANFALWQGKCREMFLFEYCPSIYSHIRNGLLLITTNLNLNFISQAFAFDRIKIRMFLHKQNVNRLMMVFKYYKISENGETLLCEGSQTTAAMKEIDGNVVAVPYPGELIETFETFGIIKN